MSRQGGGRSGKLQSGPRPVHAPVNIPSLRKKNLGHDPAVNLVNSGAAGWQGDRGTTQPQYVQPMERSQPAAPVPREVNDRPFAAFLNERPEVPPVAPPPVQERRDSPNQTWGNNNASGGPRGWAERAGGNLGRRPTDFPSLGGSEANAGTAPSPSRDHAPADARGLYGERPRQPMQLQGRQESNAQANGWQGRPEILPETRPMSMSLQARLASQSPPGAHSGQDASPGIRPDGRPESLQAAPAAPPARPVAEVAQDPLAALKQQYGMAAPRGQPAVRAHPGR